MNKLIIIIIIIIIIFSLPTYILIVLFREYAYCICGIDCIFLEHLQWICNNPIKVEDIF
jgi:hypothetical protein